MCFDGAKNVIIVAAVAARWKDWFKFEHHIPTRIALTSSCSLAATTLINNIIEFSEETGAWDLWISLLKRCSLGLGAKWLVNQITTIQVVATVENSMSWKIDKWIKIAMHPPAPLLSSFLPAAPESRLNTTMAGISFPLLFNPSPRRERLIVDWSTAAVAIPL